MSRRQLRRGALAAAVLSTTLLVPTGAAQADGHRDFTFRDRRITESSGLVDLGRLVITTNDSGSAAKLYAVDPTSGRTVGVTNYYARTVDVEALAPAGRAAVWVGDIGDNDSARKTLRVFRVKVGRGRIDVRPVGYRLRYPRGPHDAEAMFVDRRGRLHVITKSFTGGTVFRAPARLSAKRVHRLRRVGRVPEYVTDAAMLPGRRHLLVRGLGSAAVYTFPSLERLGRFQLPPQRQGEGVSVGPGGRIRLSTEGVRTKVRTVKLPATVVQQMRGKRPPPPSSPAPPSPSASASSSPSATASPTAPSAVDSQAGPRSESAPRADPTRPRPWFLWAIPVLIGIGALGIGLGLRRRSE